MWHEGTIGIPKKKGGYTVVHYWVKAYEEGSQYGIDGGCISKLSQRINGEWAANYDRGWDLKPTCEAAQKALELLMMEYN